MTAEEQKKIQALEAENALLKEQLLRAQQTLAKYAQMLFGQKTERVRLPEKFPVFFGARNHPLVPIDLYEHFKGRDFSFGSSSPVSILRGFDGNLIATTKVRTDSFL